MHSCSLEIEEQGARDEREVVSMKHSIKESLAVWGVQP